MKVTVEHLPWGFAEGGWVEVGDRVFEIVSIDRDTKTLELKRVRSVSAWLKRVWRRIRSRRPVPKKGDS